MNRWESDAFDNIDLANIIKRDLKERLQVRPHPHFGWRSMPNQQLSTLSTNEQGLRSPSVKPNAKNIILLLGGSFAWGFGASSNKYIPSSLIEYGLNTKYNDEFNVINLADQMYCSIEEIKSFIFTVDELSPKIVIVITGQNDVARSFKKQYKVTAELKREIEFFHWGYKTGIIWTKSCIKTFIKLLLSFNYSKIQNIYKDDYFTFCANYVDNIPVQAMNHKLDVISSYCMAKGIKIVYLLQPHLMFKKNKSIYENDYYNYLKQDEEYFNYLNEHYQYLKNIFKKNTGNNQNNLFLDTTNYFDDYNYSIFFDGVHISDNGYKIFCDKMTEEIGSIL